ncbi:hypothetical protein SK128_021533, partial [Halocaridina rubra]
MENINEEKEESSALTTLCVGGNISDDIGIGVVNLKSGKNALVSDGTLSVLAIQKTASDVAEPPLKRKRTRIDLNTKFEIVEKFEGGQRTAVLSEEYGISQRRIYDFCVAVKKIRAAQNEGESSSRLAEQSVASQGDSVSKL